MKTSLIIFIVKLTFFQCFVIHYPLSMWSAYHCRLFRPGLHRRCQSLALNNSTRPRNLLRFSLNLPQLSLSLSLSQPSRSLSSPSPFLAVMSFNDKDTNNEGAASSAPSDRGSSSRSARPLSSRNFNGLFGGAQSSSVAPPPIRESEDPLGTAGAPIARAPLLKGAHFA